MGLPSLRTKSLDNKRLALYHILKYKAKSKKKIMKNKKTKEPQPPSLRS